MALEISGKFLNQLWKIGAQHTLYSHDGTWFHQLKRFPGALCDSEGYVLFPTKEAFQGCKELRVRKDVGCSRGIREIPGYVRCDAKVATDIGIPTRPERVLQRVSRIIRDTAISSEIKLLYDHHCQICGLTLEIGGKNYSEAHHIRPLGRPHDGSDSRDNLLCVCPNCHVLLDYAAIRLESKMLKLRKHQISDENVAYHNALFKNEASMDQGSSKSINSLA